MVVFGIGCKCESGRNLNARIRIKFDFLLEGFKKLAQIGFGVANVWSFGFLVLLEFCFRGNWCCNYSFFSWHLLLVVFDLFGN